jgi:hypothetical protein
MVVVIAVLRFVLVDGFHVAVWLVHNPLAGIPVSIVAWVVFVHFSPYGKCRWCRTPEQRKRFRGRQCWRCHGSKLVRRLGAKQVHKVKLALQQQWAERTWWR